MRQGDRAYPGWIACLTTAGLRYVEVESIAGKSQSQRTRERPPGFEPAPRDWNSFETVFQKTRSPRLSYSRPLVTYDTPSRSPSATRNVIAGEFSPCVYSRPALVTSASRTSPGRDERTRFGHRLGSQVPRDAATSFRLDGRGARCEECSWPLRQNQPIEPRTSPRIPIAPASTYSNMIPCPIRRVTIESERLRSVTAIASKAAGGIAIKTT